MDKEALLQQHEILKAEYVKLLNDKDVLISWGKPLETVREAKNEFDKFAVALHFKKNKIGYIPKDKNETVARLMDAGKSFFATIEAKDLEGNWLKIEVKVYLKD